MGPMCFDYGFGPFRWVCASGNPEDLAKTDKIASDVLEEMIKTPQQKSNNKWRITFNGLKERRKIN